ncbi:uncharacterized protein Z518_06194 [Rhinocladiella mackenziei CBS 650.93]|uniref:Rhinocladiella mackenziei CBS 650.93 unplaced genomic scaffold supercont1.4, whole genome shotgun sequence n=1 Tax=Rhinocladiella mackenziei CBS 650.93 TaxID=1442369 RepID=A0A0D2FT91_9EURO|nr:uncharacterized protein Z518_06194 [Rhinocladiella mackenziei CBS 650.93]KIX05322.1 hypothetical protein Z518_06194 [Rhinocladiella mackenziei CBS 650.93]
MAPETNESPDGTPYTLYHNYYSICSIMMRYLMRIRGDPVDAAAQMNVAEQHVDIFNEEQFSEKYLLEVNPNGQVPVLGSLVAFSYPLAQTTAISAYVSERYPALMPVDHAETIRKSLIKMHELNFFTLSFLKSPKLASGFADVVLKRLANNDISEEYRKALEYKLMILKRDKVDALQPAKIENEVSKATAYMQELASFLRPDAGPWMFGQQRPTALDAHLVVMIARLQDVGRDDIIPETLKAYGDMAMNTPEWLEVMDGRRTMYDGSGLARKD